MDSEQASQDDWESQLIEYSLGAMQGQQAEVFAARLAECREHVRRAQEYEQVVTWLALSTPAAEPPPGHKSRLMSRVSATPQAAGPPARDARVDAAPFSPGTAPLHGVKEGDGARADRSAAPVLLSGRPLRRNSIVVAVGAVAASLILIVGLWALFARTTGLNIPAGSTVVALEPQPGYPNVRAVVVYDPNGTEAVFLAEGMDPLPLGKVYELWILPREGQPINAGVFSPQSGGQGAHRARADRPVGTYAGFAVTIEDAPGVASPQGPMVVAGTFASP